MQRRIVSHNTVSFHPQLPLFNSVVSVGGMSPYKGGSRAQGSEKLETANCCSPDKVFNPLKTGNAFHGDGTRR